MMHFSVNMLIEVMLIVVGVVMFIRNREKDRKVAYSWGTLGLFAGVILILGLCGIIKL